MREPFEVPHGNETSFLGFSNRDGSSADASVVCCFFLTVVASAASMAKLPLSLDYVPPGRGRDLSRHKSGQEGFKKVVEDFAASLSSYDRRSLELEEKVVIVGDSQVGKSCLLHRFMNDSYNDKIQSTLGLDLHKQLYTYAGFDFTLSIWDTAGQERFQSGVNFLYRGAKACICTFDLGAPITLPHVKQWVDKLKKENRNTHEDDWCVFLVGCKADMFHTISDTQAQHVAAELNAEYFELSAKSGVNVRTLFDRVACVLFERALLRQIEEWKTRKIVKLTTEEDLVEELLLGDLSCGKGIENWKQVKSAPKKSCCCWMS